MPHPISEDQSVLRTSLIPQMVESLGRNYSRQINEACFYELGRVFNRENNNLIQSERVSFGMMGPVGRRQLNKRRPLEAEEMFIWMKGLIEVLLNKQNLNDLIFKDLDNQKYKKIILGSWCLIFIITTFDLIFEFIIGNNILGFVSYMPGRLAGFFNDELIMGHYFYGFILIIISFLYQNLNDSDFKKIIKLNNQNLIYFFIILFLIVSILIGERANFIRTLIMVSIFVFFLNDYKIKKKLIVILSATILFFIIVFNHQDYKVRFMGQFIAPFVKDPMSYITSSSYWDHYKVGIDIFNKNKSFGVGLKNYRVYTEDKNYHNPSIHPHQIQIEILSELGITGYFSLLLVLILNIYKSIKSVNFSQNLLKLSGLLFILTFFLPLLPTGSFFTSHAATLFWMNFALILNLKKKSI